GSASRGSARRVIYDDRLVVVAVADRKWSPHENKRPNDVGHPVHETLGGNNSRVRYVDYVARNELEVENLGILAPRIAEICEVELHDSRRALASSDPHHRRHLRIVSLSPGQSDRIQQGNAAVDRYRSGLLHFAHHVNELLLGTDKGNSEHRSFEPVALLEAFHQAVGDFLRGEVL